ncbi:16S rRNA (uracil(1498)-N(3))-methyltransferase [Candidatus Dojkabacteria bacterium]|nr:16S rRNA (uracil(1498)-N(3))-methyltransferase [Candidatus Dojkabacteria bacterium]
MDYSRFFIPKEKIFNGKFSLENPADVRKIRQVLRLKRKDKIILLDNSDQEYLAEIEKPTKLSIKGIILESRPLLQKAGEKLQITLAQGLPKASKMDDVIRMNTELGISGFIPFESKYSVLKLDNFNPKKLTRWEKIAKSASEQSERKEIPEITGPMNFGPLLEQEADIKLLLHSRQLPGSKNISEITSLLENNSHPTHVLVAIGPEGGFSDEEISQAKEVGWQLIWLNLPILRTETAGVIVCSYLILNS